MGRHIFTIIYLLAAILAGCARAPATQPVAQRSYIDAEDLGHNTTASAYVAPQSAPVLSPSYPALGGSVIQTGTGSIPIVQGR